MTEETDNRHDLWARLRFSVVGPLLAAPPAKGALRAELEKLAAKTWRHPITGDGARFGRSTIERWYYAAKRERRDPVRVLRRRIRKDAGATPSVTPQIAQFLRAQYREHPGWSYKLHLDNARTVREDVPAYVTLRRWMKAQGLMRVRRRRPPATAAEARAAARLVEREVRSYEVEYVHGLWHADFHVARRKVLTRQGRWITPHLFGALDDRSRLACHVQWYLTESAETFAHGLSQALMKRGLPRALMTDHGSAMLAGEILEGLHQLSIVHEPTLPHSPYQNAKMEVFWAVVEGRLMPMLEGVAELTLDVLNEATQALVEMEYNRVVHSETGTTPLSRFLDDRSVGRESPGSDDLRRAFRAKVARIQRKSDGTVALAGRRFEVPSRFRHMDRLCLRYARWDLAAVELVDPRTGQVLATLSPLDKTKNADGMRRVVEAITEAAPAAGGVAPLLKKLMAEYAATGLPPAFLPKED